VWGAVLCGCWGVGTLGDGGGLRLMLRGEVGRFGYIFLFCRWFLFYFHREAGWIRGVLFSRGAPCLFYV
jgi:hypothetical protein